MFGGNRGQGRGRGRGGGRGMGRCGKGMGPGGVCVCPKCGTEIPHTPGVACVDEKCPRCGSRMIRKGIK